VIGDHWGVTDAEMTRHYPCDDFVPTPVMTAYRGVTVLASPAQVWLWVTQIRLAPYSYDWIDNLGHRSPRELRGLPEPVVGEPLSTGFGRRTGRILAVTQGEALTGWIAGATMSYLLVPDDESTRLLLKVVLARGHRVAPLICLGDLVMARRQLLNFKRLAESG
jgi:hypothetical protein